MLLNTIIIYFELIDCFQQFPIYFPFRIKINDIKLVNNISLPALGKAT